jgi:tetratricopeptide (TPR) repeat protein
MPLRFGRGAPEYERKDATAIAERAVGRTLSPSEVSSYWSGRAFDFITSQPLAWLRLLGRKFVLLWNRTEVLDTESQETYAEWSIPLRAGSAAGNFGILVPLALFGLLATWPLRHRIVVFYAVAAGYTASVLMFYVFARYRFPLVPLLVLFAAGGLTAGRRVLGVGSSASTYLGLAIVAAAAVLTNWPVLSPAMMQAVTETNLGAALHDEQRFDEALAHYRRAIALKSDYAPAFSNMGVTLAARGQLDEAVVAYERAIALQPDEPHSHYNLADALLKKTRPDAAGRHLSAALVSAPDSVEVHNNLGLALATEGRLEGAVAQFRQALQVDQRSAKAHRNLADVLASLGRQDEAFDHFRRAIELEPNDGALHYDYGSVLIEAGRFSEAIEEFRTTLRLTPESFEAHNNLGIALGSQGRLDEAIVHFQLALKLQPQSVDAQRNLEFALQARTQRR